MLALSQDLEFVFFRVLCFGKTSLRALFPSSAFASLDTGGSVVVPRMKCEAFLALDPSWLLFPPWVASPPRVCN